MLDGVDTSALISNENVQKVIATIDGLITGKKRLVIESMAIPTTRKIEGSGHAPENNRHVIDYKHTFRIEDTNNG